ncbi:MAG: 4Fe-4S binding protein [Chloroflexi bacterium]|nr:4Fe-4S binding protein [Chloroflexota bacterium]
MTDTHVDFAGLRLKHPIGVAPQAPFAPVTPRQLADQLLRYVEEGASFVNTTSIRPEPEHPADKQPTGRFLRADRGAGSKVSGAIIFTPAERDRIQHRLEWGLELIAILRKELPRGIPLIANLVHSRPDIETWVRHAKTIEEAGADLIELNPSCPLDQPAQSEGEETEEIVAEALGDSPAALSQIVSAVAAVVKVPVGIKFSPESGYPRLINAAYRYHKAGARYVACVNAPMSIAPPDIRRGGRGRYPGFDENPFAPIVGPWVRYLAYRNTAAIARFVPDLDIATVGGIVEGEHVVEALMLGAKTVELSSGILLKGIPFIRQAVRFLESYMDEMGFQSLDQIRGLGLQYIKAPSAIDWGMGRLRASIDPHRCNGCGICANNLCFAIRMNGDKPGVDVSTCSACSLCIAACPRGAISLAKGGL